MYFSGMSHELYMKRCLDLAQMAYPACRPNPMVGAVLVVGDKVISEGYTQAYGGPHAEVVAIEGVSDELLKQATLYVSLEPCAHHGKTPPCADLVVRKGIPHVVIATRDPYSEVNGQGVARLEAAGVQVTEGVLSDEAVYMNRRFFTFHQKNRPYVLLKWAESADGYIDVHRTRGSAAKISGSQSQQLVHLWRSQEAAILVGGHTARLDNPCLDVRLLTGQSPERFVWSSQDLPVDYHLAKLGYTRLAAASVQELLAELYSRGLQSLLVEGGAQVLQQFIDSGHYDEAYRLIAPAKLGSGVAAPIIDASPVQQFRSGKDMVWRYLT